MPQFHLVALLVFVTGLYKVWLVSADDTQEDPITITASKLTKDRRPNLLPPRGGTINWERLTSSSVTFSPRHGHATTVFPCPEERFRDCLWLVGGRSEEHYSFDLIKTDKNDDVWWSYDGENWKQVTDLDGDFIPGASNHDAKPRGHTAPWYARFAHSLTSMDVDNDGTFDVMVLIGGYNPMPSKDVWISTDGSRWYLDGFAPFEARAHHAAVVFQGSLWVMGGTPLTNDVWEGTLIASTSRKAGYTVQWRQRLAYLEAPWLPRAGLCAVTQWRRQSNETSLSNVVKREYLYIMGGYGGWPREDPRHNGERGRNDVWVTTDGVDWKRVMPPEGMYTMPWQGRAFHSCVTWHDSEEPSIRVGTEHALNKARSDVLKSTNHLPRIYLLGGGYFGQKANNDVRFIRGYLDLWWTDDGSRWTQVNYLEGTTEYNKYSSCEWTNTMVENEIWYKGKYGQTLEAFFTSLDVNGDNQISNIEIEFLNDRNSTMRPKILQIDEAKIPALFVIGGKHSKGEKTSDVFVSRTGGKFVENVLSYLFDNVLNAHSLPSPL